MASHEQRGCVLKQFEPSGLLLSLTLSPTTARLPVARIKILIWAEEESLSIIHKPFLTDLLLLQIGLVAFIPRERRIINMPCPLAISVQQALSVL